jgi:hypothetical protein
MRTRPAPPLTAAALGNRRGRRSQRGAAPAPGAPRCGTSCWAALLHALATNSPPPQEDDKRFIGWEGETYRPGSGQPGKTWCGRRGRAQAPSAGGPQARFPPPQPFHPLGMATGWVLRQAPPPHWRRGPVAPPSPRCRELTPPAAGRRPPIRPPQGGGCVLEAPRVCGARIPVSGGGPAPQEAGRSNGGAPGGRAASRPAASDPLRFRRRRRHHGS